MKPLVYVAGPITRDPWGCIRRALPVFDALIEAECVPFLPQFSIVADMIRDGEYEQWMAYDFDVIDLSSALVRLPGDSPGADREVNRAFAQQKPVLSGDTVEAIVSFVPAWAKRWQERLVA